jgi:hypothetical protein
MPTNVQVNTDDPQDIDNKGINGFINVKSRGAVGDGVANDRQIIITTFNETAHPKIIFPEGTYNLGDLGTNPPISLMTINGNGGAIRVETIGKVKFICNTQANTITYLFQFVNANSVFVGPMEFEDSGYDPNITWKGAAALLFYADTNVPNLRNITVPFIRADNLVTPITIIGDYNFPEIRISNIKIGIMDCNNTFYGLSCQNNADYLTCDLLRTNRAVRSYFPYGCKNHRVNMVSYNHRSSTADVDIACYDYGTDTEDIKVKYFSRGDPQGDHVSFQTIGNTRICMIKNIDIEVDIDESNAAVVADWKDYPYSSLSSPLNTGSSNNFIDGIKLSGRIGSNGNISSATHFAVQHQPTNPTGKISFSGDFAQHRITDGARAALQQAHDHNAHSFTWTASLSDPTIGNGTYNTRYWVNDGMCEVLQYFRMGSTSNVGSGAFRFGTPFTPITGIAVGADMPCGVAKIAIPGVGFKMGTVVFSSSQSYVQIEPHGELAYLGSSTYAWVEDSIISLHYRIPIGHDHFA